MAATPSAPERLLSRLLRPVARVEPGEALGALLLGLSVFLLLGAYYLLKTAREPLILLHGGAELKSYAAAGQAVLLVLFVRGYEAVARRVGRLRLLAIVYLFFVLNLLVFAALAAARLPIAVPFYLWVGVFNYVLIAQFWAFAADVYTPQQGKRLFAVLGAGSSLGAVVGARLAAALVHLGPAALMLGAAALLGASLLLIAVVQRPGARDAQAETQPLSLDSALALLRGNRFLLLLAAATVLINWVNSNGEYLLDRTLLDTVAGAGGSREAAAVFIGRFKAEYFAWVNAAGVLLQLFLVSRLMGRLGVRGALLVLPLVALGGYGLLLLAPALGAIRVAKIAENSIDYSLQNTARQALYLAATRPEKFVGKTAVDTVFVRLGDVLSAGVVSLAAWLALPTRSFALFNVGLAIAWLAVVMLLGREHDRRAGLASVQPAPRPEPERSAIGATT